MNGEVSHERARRLQRGTLATLLLVACYSGCDPDLDQLSSEYGSATGGSSNASGGAIGSGGSARGGANSGGTSSPGAGHAGMTNKGGGTSAGGAAVAQAAGRALKRVA
jgi:hypothetical protein